MFSHFRGKKCITLLLGSAVLAFGLYHIHAQSGITEGGILGMTLLLQHWFSVSPAWSALVMNGLCYGLGAFLLGRDFIVSSVIAGAGFSLFYRIFECFPPLWPQLAQQPFMAAVLGAVFVGIGVGLCVREQGAPSGDDALALCMEKKLRLPIQWAYLISDVTVLLLSLSYIPAKKLLWSLLTVVLSGQLVGFVQRFGKNRE